MMSDEIKTSRDMKTILENVRHLNIMVEKVEVVLKSLVSSVESQDVINIAVRDALITLGNIKAMHEDSE